MATREDRIIRRVHRLQALMYVFGAAIVILFSLLVYAIHQNTQAINQAHTAICGEKLQIEQTVKSTKNFLRDHPKGISGVPNALLRQGLTQAEAQLKGLGPVSCN